MFTPLAVKAYDPAGDLVVVTDTTEIRAPSGVLKILQADNVVSVEIHYDDEIIPPHTRYIEEPN